MASYGSLSLQFRITEAAISSDGMLKLHCNQYAHPRVKPRAGETKRVPIEEKAPETGIRAAISPRVKTTPKQNKPCRTGSATVSSRAEVDARLGRLFGEVSFGDGSAHLASTHKQQGLLQHLQ